MVNAHLLLRAGASTHVLSPTQLTAPLEYTTSTLHCHGNSCTGAPREASRAWGQEVMMLSSRAHCIKPYSSAYVRVIREGDR